MNTIYDFEKMVNHLSANGRQLRIAVVCGYDDSSLQAVTRALAGGFARAVFVGDDSRVRSYAPLTPHWELTEFVTPSTDEAAEAARVAVNLVREGKADILMKGLISTDVLLRAVLDKECGLLPKGNVLTHLAVAQVPGRDRLLFFTDSAVIPYPTPEQRAAQVGYVIDICHAFGITQPKVSLIHCSEHVSEKFPHTMTYAALSRRAQAGEWGQAVVDGPLDVRTSLDPVALHVKGIASPLEGQADALVFPDIEAGNTFYKTMTFLAHSHVAGMLLGTLCPVVLPSRGDSADDKYFSLAFAAMGCSNPS